MNALTEPNKPNAYQRHRRRNILFQLRDRISGTLRHRISGTLRHQTDMSASLRLTLQRAVQAIDNSPECKGYQYFGREDDGTTADAV